ncbi:hypothetical protein LZK76_10905 [Rhizobium leguminosarum]|nr:hypothetical protein LZK76_10905 [Rhizobium leguminosarum]
MLITDDAAPMMAAFLYNRSTSVFHPAGRFANERPAPVKRAQAHRDGTSRRPGVGISFNDCRTDYLRIADRRRRDTVKCDEQNMRLRGEGLPFVSGIDTPEIGVAREVRKLALIAKGKLKELFWPKGACVSY